MRKAKHDFCCCCPRLQGAPRCHQVCQTFSQSPQPTKPFFFFVNCLLSAPYPAAQTRREVHQTDTVINTSILMWTQLRMWLCPWPCACVCICASVAVDLFFLFECTSLSGALLLAISFDIKGRWKKQLCPRAPP